jgi:uncharacterized protein (TIGR03437 family)
MRWSVVVFLATIPMFAQQAEFTEVARGFASPIDIQFPAEGARRMFIVEQAGRIRVVQSGQTQSTLFLDIAARVSAGGERGLLGLAFPPGFTEKRHFYVNYTDNGGDTVIARYRVSAADANAADSGSEQILLRIPQPAANHNGGQLQFGPDGYLYIGMGDGGGSNDTFQNAQNRQSLLGKMLRIDVEGGQVPYGIPPDNPFVGNAQFAPEIWALGLRNPWRFSFDRETGEMWIGDVGQNRAEEMDLQPASSAGGENYGWPLMEGFTCRGGGACDPALVRPVHEYTRGQGDQSISGGYVYRGARVPSQAGRYFFADFVSGRIWTLRREGGLFLRTTVRGPGFNVSTFGQDGDGEIYVANYSGGVIYRIEPALELNAVNAASFEAGLTPGSAATAFLDGILDSDQVIPATAIPLPTTLGGVAVFVNGAPAPLYAVSRDQVNFQAPFGLAAPGPAAVEIRRNGAPLAAANTGVLAFQPGVFSYEGTTNAIVVHNSDYTLANEARPAEEGENVFFYATGLGPVSGPPPTGDAAPVSPLAQAATAPEVAIAGIRCDVQFAGLAPGLVGVYQVNIRIPEGVPPGAQELIVRAGGASSPPATILVR